MNIKRFRRVCKISSYVLKGFSIVALLITAYAFFQILVGNSNVWFTYDGPSIPIVSFGGSMQGIPITDEEYRLAALIITPFIVLVSVYVFWKGAQLFKRLADGATPFNFKFAKSLKHLSVILILSDIVFPIFYSTILSAIYTDGYQYNIGLSSSFLIGIILYAISEIFYYGIELQHLADETV